MLFAHLDYERTLQVNDKTRIDASKCYASPDSSLTKIEIQPSATDSFYNVTELGYLDWQYSTAGSKVVSVKLNETETTTYTILVLTESDDSLFSFDSDLIPHEQDIYNFLRAGKTTFKDIHRQAQRIILNSLAERRIYDDNGDRLTKAAIVDIDEVREWSKYTVLRLLFESQSNATDDVFAIKAQRYKDLEVLAGNKTALKLDLDGDGTLDDARIDLVSIGLLRR